MPIFIWRKRNHTSVNKYIVEVMAMITKDHRNRNNIPLPNLIARYLLHCFIMPQHALKKSDKSTRLIFDASNHYEDNSGPVKK